METWNRLTAAREEEGGEEGNVEKRGKGLVKEHV